MTLDDLHDIHVNMLKAVEAAKGKIERIYFCTDTEEYSPCRKPNPGMAFQAVGEFPEINLEKSIMVGNNLSDMYFGKNAGMKTVFLKTTSPDIILPHATADLFFENLDAFALALKKS
jgi:HAD superfamily hydrolase (TIGR01662 family)